MKQISLLFILLATSWWAAAEEASSGFVSDNVYTYLHAGPGNQFRILGSVSAGASITIIASSEDGKYTRIRDGKEREGWIQTEFVSREQSLKNRHELLQQQYDEATSEIDTLKQQIARLSQVNSNWQQQKQQLNDQLLKAQASEQKALASLAGEDERLKMEWLIKGGGLLAGGILFGVILTFLPKRKRDRGGWA